MKPAAFDYHAPRSVDEVLHLLAEHGEEARVLAGGQSLVPAMNFRLARPAVLVDLNRVAGLDHLQVGQGAVSMGAMLRQRQVERSPELARSVPLLAGTMPYVAHAQIRNRGTVGGSIAHSDPAAELPAVLLALGGRCRIRGSQGERWVEAERFFLGLFETAVQPGELLVEVEFPTIAAREGWGFHEMARRHGDFALVGVAAQLRLDEQGIVRRARLALLSVGEGPVLATAASALLEGERADPGLLAAAAEAVQKDIEPNSDLHASAAYRRHLATVLSRRALEDALRRART